MSDDNELGLPKCECVYVLVIIGCILDRCKNASKLSLSFDLAATIQKMVKQYVQKDVKVAADTMEMLISCCSGELGNGQRMHCCMSTDLQICHL